MDLLGGFTYTVGRLLKGLQTFRLTFTNVAFIVLPSQQHTGRRHVGTITVYLFDEEGQEVETRLPARWVICHECEGNGRHSKRLGDFTGSEWREACSEDPDFAEDYFAGRYDSGCDACKGSGKVEILDEEACDAATLEAYRAHCEEEAHFARICAAERAFGA